jgi:L-threonylcarbamoyladenylate synthase
MKSMKLFWQDPAVNKKITDSLQRSEILITTTDTIPGFLANVTQQGFYKVNDIKGGRQNKPYIILISDLSKLGYFIGTQSLQSDIQKILEASWPGPLTAIFKSRPDLPGFLKSDQGMVALRCPRHSGLLNLLKNFSGLFSTSANKSAQPAPKTISAVTPEILSQVSHVVEDLTKSVRPEPAHPKLVEGVEGLIERDQKPSTILDFSRYSQDKKIYLVREGAYSLAELEQLSGLKIIK